jgi:hypothetical protein
MKLEYPEVRFALAALIAVFFIFTILFRKKIGYFFCPLPNYEGKIYKGKSHYLFLFHFFVSFGLSIAIYASLNENNKISEAFDDVVVRLLSIAGIWIVFFYIIGLLI